MITLADERLALAKVSAVWLRRPGVVSVGIAGKLVGGKPTGELAIVVGVEKKDQVLGDQGCTRRGESQNDVEPEAKEGGHGSRRLPRRPVSGAAGWDWGPGGRRQPNDLVGEAGPAPAHGRSICAPQASTERQEVRRSDLCVHQRLRFGPGRQPGERRLRPRWESLVLDDFGNRAASVRRYDGTTGAFLGVLVPAGSGGLGWGAQMVLAP